MDSSIKIIKQSRPFTDIEKYLLTMNPEIISVKDLEDEFVIQVKGFLIFEDRKDEDDVSTIMSILGEGCKAYATQSKTFMNSLLAIHDIMQDKPYGIKKISGTTKAGRPYVNCILDISSVQ